MAKILSLFDGMACGMLAMQKAGVEVERYVAYEIDKYAVQTSSHNFPLIEHRGDVFKADFTEFRGFDFVLAGFPCTKFSIAQKNDRETTPYSGEGWLLFEQAWRAVCEAKPKYFLFENNKSMAKAVQQEISKIVGFEPVCINSALVSAQNRQRLYWVGKRNDDGTYSKVNVEQPEDRGILLRDILDYEPVATNDDGKAYALTASYYKGPLLENSLSRKQRSMVAEPFNVTAEGKSQTIKAQYQQTSIANICCYTSTYGASGVAEPVAMRQVGRRINESGHRDDYNVGEVQTVQKAIPEIVAKKGYLPEMFNPYNRAEITEKSPTLSTGSMVTSSCATLVVEAADGKTGLYVIPCCSMTVKEATKKGYTEIKPGECVDMTQPNSKTRRGRNMADKSNCLMTSCQYYQYCGVLAYATPCEWDENGNVIKAVSVADGKTYTVYEVKDGQITIKGKQYPIKLVDGFYIIRKLTVRECMRLQTVPEWYEFPVSDRQAYKMLGNGFTVDVIVHLISSATEVLYGKK